MDVYWLEQTDADLPAENDWLSASETDCLNAMRFPKRRADWRLGRWTAKHALAAYRHGPGHREALALLEIRAAPSGAPEAFFSCRPAAVRISISHRAGRAVCAIAGSDAALGCDLELVEPRSEGFLADYFTPEEQALVARAPAADRPALATLLWSAKESGLKALRTGLRLDTRSLSVSPNYAPRLAGDSDTWHPLLVHHASGAFHGWWRKTEGFLFTVVAAPPPAPPVCLEVPVGRF
ncbi:MAG: 4'-phosphopantetheinyl transferase superfamily protein [Acidobacteriia bacterium]|nr:4'-phosphopantetheinyl transferase superfamily protein [Terriglobia bacterium]